MSVAWFKFYPSDWRADPALRMCSIAARGLWMEMLCVMHEATPRGSLLINGKRVAAPKDDFTGDLRLPVNLGWDREGRITLDKDDSRPGTVLGITGSFSVADD